MTSSSRSARFVRSFVHEQEAAAPAPAADQPVASTTPLPAAELFGWSRFADAPAAEATTARFDVDLRRRPTLPGDTEARLQAEAQAAGYAAGWAEGRRAAEVAAAAERDQVAAQVR